MEMQKLAVPNIVIKSPYFFAVLSPITESKTLPWAIAQFRIDAFEPLTITTRVYPVKPISALFVMPGSSNIVYLETDTSLLIETYKAKEHTLFVDTLSIGWMTNGDMVGYDDIMNRDGYREIWIK